MTRILRLPETMHRTGYSRSTLYAKVKANEFPRPRKLGARAVGWLESEINDWIESRALNNGGEAQ